MREAIQFLQRAARVNVAVRLLLLLGALQLSGQMHFALDLLAGSVEDECSTSCDDDKGSRCPPMCSDCACSHGVRPMLTGVSSINLFVATPAGFPIVSRLSIAPKDPLGRSIFQPPRA